VPRPLFLTIAFLSLLGPLQTPDFAFLQPWFEVTREERAKLVQRGVVVRGLPASNKQISVIAACAVAISPDAFVARIRAAGDVKRTESPAGRFDDPPVIANLAGLSLDEGDLDRLRRCRRGDCRLNLADHEIAAVQQALASSAAGDSTKAQGSFRAVVLDRVRRYQSQGLGGLPEYHDRREPVRPAAIFSDIVQQTPYLKTHVPGIAAYLERYPFGKTEGAESFLLWSKMTMNDKAVGMVTHRSIFRPMPGPQVPTVLMTSKQVYASRYMNGELALTMLFAGAAGSPSYLVHVNRSELDELEGALSGLKRAVIERRIKEEAASRLAVMRDGFERGH